MGFFDRISNSWNIFKISFDFLRRDKSLMLVPVIGVLTIAAALILFFFLAAPLLQSGGWLLMILFLLIINIIAVFFAAIQSWMVYEVAVGKDATLSSGAKRAFNNLFDIILFVIASLVVGSVLRAVREKGGVFGEIASGAAGVFVGIAQKLIIPAMIIGERNFWDSVKYLGKATKVLPEIAVYEIGMGPLFFAAFLIDIAIAFIASLIFGFVPAVILFVVILVLMIYLYNLIDQIYYTLLYLTVLEKKKVKGLKLK
ncbi:MAG TPA: hypothetical protein VJJ21_00920 [Candidatus Nanoarchaeia archaeon]|nr:hypothetical protein [Candidatus Nanoarchaeia archaeon]